MLDYANHFLFLAKFEILFYNLISQTCHSSLGVRHSLSNFTSPFLRFLPLIIPQPPYFATFYIHLLASNEPKNSQVFLTSNMVGEILRFDHCRCLEKQLLKLLGVKPPFLIDPLPFRNLPPFWIKFFTHPFQCIFKFLNPLFNKKGG